MALETLVVEALKSLPISYVPPSARLNLRL